MADMATRRFGLAAAALSIAGVAAIAVVARAHNAGGELGSCAVADKAFLQPTDLVTKDSFVRNVDLWQHSAPPLRGALSDVKGTSQGRPAATTEYVDGRLIGYLDDVAVVGPDRTVEDAYSRGLGYAVGKLPLVPLQGPVVAHNSGLLEAYENVWEYSSEGGARAMLGVFRGSHGGLADMTTKDVPVQLGDESVGYSMVPAPPDPELEHWVHLEARVKNIVISITAQGGRALSVRDVTTLLEHAVDHALSACA